MAATNDRAEALISQFTSDPQLKAEIYQHMSDFQDGKTSLDQIIAQYTKDPALVATIKQYVSKTQGGFQPQSLTAFGTTDLGQASSAANTVHGNKALVEHIVDEH